MERYHPGQCEATAVGKRHGKNLTPQRFDDPRHVWSQAKPTNWGPWSCCGYPAKSSGCQERGLGAYIQFLINGCDRVLVISEAENCWILSSGRIAKKATEGSSWVWAKVNDNEESLNHILSRLSTQGTRHSVYSFGDWGYHNNGYDSQIMSGFSYTPPGVEICGTYEVVFVAALRYDVRQQQANIFLRRQPKSGSLVIEASTQNVTIGVDGRQGNTRGPTRLVTDQVIFDGEVSLGNEGPDIDRYFGPGYKFYGFAADSEATHSYTSMASNASLIVTKRNDNKGRIYQVNSPKAFKLVQNEAGAVADESGAFGSQEHEVNVARRICKSPHYSFLCRELGLPCSASALITAFVTEHPPFIFAEPGDIWIDIRLSTPTRTYVLARPKSGVVFSEEKLESYTERMRMRFLQDLDEKELLASADVLLSTPNAGNTIAHVSLEYAINSNATERSSIIDMICILHNKGKVSKSDIEEAVTEHVDSPFFRLSVQDSNWFGEIFSAFWNIGVLDVDWLYDSADDSMLKEIMVVGAMRAIQMSYGLESVRSCFGALSEREALMRIAFG